MSNSYTTAERLREVLHYDPETGVFTWRAPTTNRVQVGDQAGAGVFDPDGVKTFFGSEVMEVFAEYEAENGGRGRILAVSPDEAVLEFESVYPEFTTERDVYVKRGMQLFRQLPTGVEVGPLHEGLKPGSGYFIRSSLPAAEVLAEALGVEPSYSVRFAHSDSDVPGMLAMTAKTDAAFIEKLKAFVEDGFRNGTWANAELKSGAAVGYRNKHGKAVGGVRT